MSPRERARAISFIPQSEEPVGGFSALDYVLMGRTALSGALGPISCADVEAARWALDEVGMSHLERRAVSSLSGGEFSMVRLARALASQAQVLMLGEPSSHVDVRYSIRAMEVLSAFASRGNLVLMVSHDLNLLSSFCSRAMVLRDGTILADGSPSKALSSDLLEAAFGVRPVEVSLRVGKFFLFGPRTSL